MLKLWECPEALDFQGTSTTFIQNSAHFQHISYKFFTLFSEPFLQNFIVSLWRNSAIFSANVWSGSTNSSLFIAGIFLRHKYFNLVPSYMTNSHFCKTCAEKRWKALNLCKKCTEFSAASIRKSACKILFVEIFFLDYVLYDKAEKF